MKVIRSGQVLWAKLDPDMDGGPQDESGKARDSACRRGWRGGGGSSPD